MYKRQVRYHSATHIGYSTQARHTRVAQLVYLDITCLLYTSWKLELGNAQQQKVNGRNRVKVDIYFTAVEIVNIPTETEMKAAMRCV